MGSGISALKCGRQIFTRVVIPARNRGYAKSVIGTSALAAILVLATAGMAFADGSTPENLAPSDLTTSTVKCEVCHSGHTASAIGVDI